jgi:hypothetical protein
LVGVPQPQKHGLVGFGFLADGGSFGNGGIPGGTTAACFLPLAGLSGWVVGTVATGRGAATILAIGLLLLACRVAGLPPGRTQIR